MGGGEGERGRERGQIKRRDEVREEKKNTNKLFFNFIFLMQTALIVHQF